MIVPGCRYHPRFREKRLTTWGLGRCAGGEPGLVPLVEMARRILRLVLLALVTRAAHAVWPQPATMQVGEAGLISLSPSFTLRVISEAGPLMLKAKARYNQLILRASQPRRPDQQHRRANSSSESLLHRRKAS
jgi:hypothetical protein